MLTDEVMWKSFGERSGVFIDDGTPHTQKCREVVKRSDPVQTAHVPTCEVLGGLMTTYMPNL